MRTSYQLGRVHGTPVILEGSWFIIAVLIIIVYTPVLATFAPALGGWVYAISTAFCLLLALSVFVHELAHIWVARRFGWHATELRISLMGGHTHFQHTSHSWKASCAVALAGPAVNLLLGTGGWVINHTVLRNPPTNFGEALFILIGLVTWANWCVGLFNLVPGLPLDGGRACESIVAAATNNPFFGTVAAVWSGRLSAAVVVVWVVVSGAWAHLPVTLIASLFLWMLISGSATALYQARAARAVEGLTAGDLMDPCITVRDGTEIGIGHSLSRAGAEMTDDGAVITPFVVVSTTDGELRGIVDASTLDMAVSAPNDSSDNIDSIMRSISAHAVISAELSGLDLLKYTASTGDEYFVVTDSQSLPLGVLQAARLNSVLAAAGLLR